MHTNITISVDKSATITLPLQIATQLREMINKGILKPGDKLPGTRTLAGQLGISRGSVTAAFDQLQIEGYLSATQGGPTKVKAALPLPAPEIRTPKINRANITISLNPSTASEINVRTSAWRKAWKDAGATREKRLTPAGETELREAIAQHIRLTRATPVNPDSILITGGTREGLMLILMSFQKKLRVGVEDPGFPSLRKIITLLGHELIPYPIDRHGVQISALEKQKPDILIITPAYLYPLGTTMPATRRSELISWAQKTNTLLIEDDFNTEVRYHLNPTPTLHPDAIVLGTFSTLLSTNLCAGYIIAPTQYIDPLLKIRNQLGMPVAGVTQRAIANLLHNGYVRKHTKTMHTRLEQRKKIVNTKLGQRVHPMGFDFFLDFPDNQAATQFEKALLKNGIEVTPANRLRTSTKPGFILSFGHLSDQQFIFALHKILEHLSTENQNDSPRQKLQKTAPNTKHENPPE